jgi:hypothetical protein
LPRAVEPVERRDRHLQNSSPSGRQQAEDNRLPSRCAPASRRGTCGCDKLAAAASRCCRIVLRLARSRSACLIGFAFLDLLRQLGVLRSQMDIAFLLSSSGEYQWCLRARLRLLQVALVLR